MTGRRVVTRGQSWSMADEEKRATGPIKRKADHETLTGMEREQLELAKLCAPLFAPELLAEWKAAQLAAVVARANKLAEALATNYASAPDADDTGWWSRLWLLEARLRHLDWSAPYRLGTRQLIEIGGHVMVCPNHGIDGVPAEAWPEGPEGVDLREGLSLRGLVEGHGALAWTRYCEACGMTGPLKLEGATLMRAWRGRSA